MSRQQINEIRSNALGIQSEHDEVLDLAIVVSRLCDVVLHLDDQVRNIGGQLSDGLGE